MKKLIIRLICLFVPNKKSRTLVKSTLNFGFINYLRTFQKEKPGKTFKHFLSLVAIAKNEGAYFREWIEFHRLVGVEKFYIYDNESTDNTYDILKPYIDQGLVEYTYFPGPKKQLPAYADCIQKHRKDTRWLGIIDLDEFMLPMAGKTLPATINDIVASDDAIAQILIGWTVYGSNGHQKQPRGLVIENYLTREEKHISPWWHKAIVNPRKVFIPECHSCAVNGKTINEDRDETSIPNTSNKAMFTVPRSYKFRNKKIRINHYAVKSFEEFMIKKYKGDPIRSKQVRSNAYFKKFDRNDVSDNVMLKYAKQIKLY